MKNHNVRITYDIPLDEYRLVIAENEHEAKAIALASFENNMAFLGESPKNIEISIINTTEINDAIY